MSSDQIGQVTRAQGARVDGELPVYALEKGALTTFQDGEAVFTGNGVTTPAEVSARLIQLEAEKDPSLKIFAKTPEAATYVASQSLDRYNPRLRGQTPDEPVPEGEQFYSRVGSDLKTLLAPFKDNIDALRELVASGGPAVGGRSVATGHGVFSEGRRLPSAKGEPAPVMDEAAVLARLGQTNN